MELEATARSLEETQDTLQKTSRALRTTRRDRDEQKYLVGQHIKTETRLHEQANQVGGPWPILVLNLLRQGWFFSFHHVTVQSIKFSLSTFIIK